MPTPFPSVNLNTQASSTAKTEASFGDGWSVNFGKQSAGMDVPWYVWAAVALGVLMVAKARKGGA